LAVMVPSVTMSEKPGAMPVLTKKRKRKLFV
jgi:hypothetical protein